MSEPIAFLNLDTATTEPSCSFQLQGRTWYVKARDDISLDVFVRLAEARKAGDAAHLQIGPFFRDVLVAGDAEDFATLLAGDPTPLTIGGYQRLMQFLTEQVLRRPTVADSGLSVGAMSTADISGDASSLPATLPEQSSA